MRTSLFTMLAALGLTGCAVVPIPLPESEIADFVSDKRARVTSDIEPINGAVGLYEAMARALKFNLDKRIEEMEILLRDRQLRVAHYSKLPQLVANTGYADRSNYSGGSSVRILGPRTIGPESLTSSTSSERDVRTADLKFSWHILDFGLSWIRAKQAADRVLIAKESRRRVVNKIIQDVRGVYWRAVTATRLISRLSRLEARVRRALRDTRALAQQGDSSPLTALTYERELVEIQREIRRLHGDLSTAKAQLAALMNADPGKRFRVIVPRRMPEPRLVGKSVGEMMNTAMSNRSELREAAYNDRINQRDAEAAILEMLPGVSFSATPNWNSNQYLFNSHWVSWGAQASWNLMKVFSYPAREAEVNAKHDLLDQRALAVTMAIMTQVHVSRARLIHSRRKFRSARHYQYIQARIVEQIRNALLAKKISEQTAIREEMNGLVAQTKLDLAYAEMQSAFANVHASMGLVPFGESIHEAMTVRELKKALQSEWRRLGDRL